MTAEVEGRNLAEELKEDERVTALLQPGEIDEVMRPENYVGQSAVIVEKVREKVERERKELGI